MIDVAKTRAKWRRSSFVWGVSDCILSVCDAVLDATGIDPAEPWRGAYYDEDGARAICEQYGGPFYLFDHGMSRAGFVWSDRASGLPVVCDVNGEQIAGIDTGARVMMRVDGRGVIEMRARVLGAWSCG